MESNNNNMLLLPMIKMANFKSQQTSLPHALPSIKISNTDTD
jgi:hypothetical protein